MQLILHIFIFQVLVVKDALGVSANSKDFNSTVQHYSSESLRNESSSFNGTGAMMHRQQDEWLNPGLKKGGMSREDAEAAVRNAYHLGNAFQLHHNGPKASGKNMVGFKDKHNGKHLLPITGIRGSAATYDTKSSPLGQVALWTEPIWKPYNQKHKGEKDLRFVWIFLGISILLCICRRVRSIRTYRDPSGNLMIGSHWALVGTQDSQEMGQADIAAGTRAHTVVCPTEMVESSWAELNDGPATPRQP